jgi:uncharacterized protein
MAIPRPILQQRACELRSKAAPDIAAEVAFLSRRDSYPERPSRVEAIETHYSWVFLTDAWAYKLKKPVKGEGFDLRSLAQRRRNAGQEMRLNRRLAPDVYVGMVPLTAKQDSGFALAGGGTTVDWLVKMVRLPAEHMLDRRLARGDLHFSEVEALGHRLAGFFAIARRSRITPRQYIERIAAELRTTREAAAKAGDARLRHKAVRVVRRIEALLARHRGTLGRRASARRLVDGHGDLRPEHVYLKGAPRVIDCLEFRPELRQLDPVDELAFLAMECGRLGAPWIGQHLFRHYQRRTRDRPPVELVRFYRALAALIRARIAMAHMEDPGRRPAAEWARRADVYFALAVREADRRGG